MEMIRQMSQILCGYRKGDAYRRIDISIEYYRYSAELGFVFLSKTIDCRRIDRRAVILYE